jgi:hypothetical protein
MQSLATRIVVALRLYAAEHGRPPARLAALAEFVPTADLIDPFSGKEFVYQPDGAGWRLYSISEDFTDDGGKVGEDRFVPDYVVQFPPPEPAAFVPTGETATN